MTTWTFRNEANLTEWTAEVDGDGDLNWSAAAGLAGSAGGIELTIDDANAMYVYTDIGANTSGIARCRYYFDPNTAAMDTNESIVLMAFRNDTPAFVALAYLFKSSTSYEILGIIYNDAGGTTETTHVAISDAPHYLELKLTRATNSTSNDGRIDVWVDGGSLQSVTGVDNYDRFNNLRYARLGVITIAGTVSGTIYIDEFVLNDTGGEIGALITSVTKSLTDSGVGTDRVSQLSASISRIDTGTGSDVISILQELFKSITDSGFGTDNFNIQASLSISDVGTGESIGVTVTLTIVDSSTGTELITITASIPVSDSGSGSDVIAVLREAIKTILDSGYGIDSPSIASSLGLSDGALGGDFLDLSASLNVPEQGSGNDIRKEMETSLILHFEPKNDGTPELNDITNSISPSTFTGFVTGTAGVFGSRGAYFGVQAQDTKYQFSSSILNSSKGTIAFWMNWTGITQTTNRVFFDAGGFTTDGFAIVKIPSSSPTVMGLRINNVQVAQGTTIIASGTWYHIINTYDYDTNQYELFVNNVVEISITGSYSTPVYPAEVCIANRISSARAAESFFDDFIILDHVATEQERNEIYNGTYLDALTLAASVSTSEIGTGSDNLSQLLAVLGLTEYGSGNDLLQLLASLSVNDLGSGSDEVSILTAVLKLISDSGLGSDNVSISVSLSVPDSSTGSDGLSIQVSLTVLDTGTGIDAETISKFEIFFKSISDLASGSDNLSISASLNVGETSIGIDDPAILASLSLGDLAGGFESPVISANLTITDVSSATDILSILQSILKQISDAGTGTDAISQITASIPVSETGLGTDQLSQLLASLIVTDFGTGVDVVVAYDSSTQIIKISFALKQRSIKFSLSQRSMGFTINPLQN